MGTNITGIGNANAIGFKSRVTGGIYFPPELKDALVGVWSAYGKSNDSTDRNIIKNKIKDRGGDFVISNAAFKLNSGFGKYEVDFTSWVQTDGVIASSDKVQNSITGRFLYFNTVNKKEDVPSFKVNITLGQQSKLQYNYIKEDGTSIYIVYSESGIYTIPASYFSKYTGGNAWFGFYQIEGTSTIEQIPSFEGAFVTDGIDDLITSTKTVQEMLGGSTEFTAVSMIHLISSGQDVGGVAYTNYIRTSDNYWTTNRVSNTDKTGIYGYSFKQGTPTVINNILGDKNDYTTEKSNIVSDGSVSDLFRANFSIEGFEHVINGAVHASSVAWYWTIIANKVLTTDQINQVIAYFNLDKYVKPDIYYNVKKQGLTNDTPDEDWYLKDFSGNGRDMTLYNYARTPESGINEEGGLQSDGVVDYGQFVGDLGLKDYTVVIDRAYNNLINNQVPLISSNIVEDQTPFIVEHWNTGSNAISFSYGASRTTDIPLDINKKIVYQSTYSYMGYVIPKGNAISTGNGITLGKFGNGVQYSAICLWSLMLFPYSMSEFLIERQLKKHKLGTLYPNMVEFRPIVKSNNKWDIIEIWQGDKSLYRPTVNDDKTGIYLKKDSTIGIYVKPYVGQKVSEIVYNGVSYTDLKLNSNGFYYITVPVTKSPQKIGITIEQDENYILFNPVINSNVEYHKLDFYLNNYQKKINIGDYIPKDVYLRANFYLKNNVDELTVFTFNGVNIGYRRSSVDDKAFNIGQIYNYDSPQEVNITIDEYIRYEDIKQPYPAFYEFTDENRNLVTWGSKIKVGSTITRIKAFADSNLLKDLYNISYPKLNGVASAGSKYVVERQMVFTCTATYLLDDNEPKCILSPRLLRIPNSSYKILDYIPDISGHGNNGVINNSAYAEGSGVNEDGSYQFDGVDDFVTIPTVTGGKQVLMKVNWQSDVGAVTLYDQRLNLADYEFAIYNGTRDLDDNSVIAYQGRNNGQTYIDGILNSNIMASELKAITHNITITNELSLGTNNTYPVIGSTRSNTHFAQMALYDFMLFDEISTDDKIKELNEYVGIEAKVELPPYYWDAYGKTNLDADKATIQQRG